jgi:hypothetical protein
MGLSVPTTHQEKRRGASLRTNSVPLSEALHVKFPVLRNIFPAKLSRGYSDIEKIGQF